MNEQTKMRKWIIEASYEDLLRRWRYAPAGDPFFQGEIGQYYKEKLEQKRAEEGTRASAISKKLG